MAQLEEEAKRVYRTVRRSPWLERFARVGFLCKGVVYILLGILAVLTALDAGGETTDPKGVVRRVADTPFGGIVLATIVCGLAAYVLWRLIAAFSDTENHGSDAKGLASRAGHLGSAVAYSLVTVYALRILLTGNGVPDNDEAQTWTARLLSAPGGFLVVILAGLIVIGVGVAQFWIAWNEGFTKFLRKYSIDRGPRRWVVRAGKAGYMARGVVFGLVGAFLIMAALQSDAHQARGMEGVLDAVAGQRYGQWLLAVIASGLTCFGVYTVVESRYRRIPH